MGGCVSTHSRGIRPRGKGRRRSSKHFSKVSDIVPHANIRRPSDVGSRVSFGEYFLYRRTCSGRSYKFWIFL